jgi:hypothetical protein
MIQHSTIMCSLHIALRLVPIVLILTTSWIQAAEQDRKGDDLTMTAQLSSDSLWLAWTNTSSHSCLLNLGGVSRDEPLYVVRLSIDYENHRGDASIASVSGVLNGRVDPWVVFMPPKSQYQVPIPLDKIRLNRSGTLVSKLSHRYTFRITYSAQPAKDYAPGGKVVPFSLTQNGPTSVPLCRGILSAFVTKE